MAGIRRAEATEVQTIDVNKTFSDEEIFVAACREERRTRKIVEKMAIEYIMKENEKLSCAEWTHICQLNASCVETMLKYAKKQNWTYRQYQDAISEIEYADLLKDKDI